MTARQELNPADTAALAAADFVPAPVNKNFLEPMWKDFRTEGHMWVARMNAEELDGKNFAPKKAMFVLVVGAAASFALTLAVYTGGGSVVSWSADKVAQARKPVAIDMVAKEASFDGLLRIMQAEISGQPSESAMDPATAFNAEGVTQWTGEVKNVLDGKTDEYLGEMTTAPLTKMIGYKKAGDVVFLSALMQQVQAYAGPDGKPARGRDQLWLGVAHKDSTGNIVLQNLTVPVRGQYGATQIFPSFQAKTLTTVPITQLPVSATAAFGQ